MTTYPDTKEILARADAATEGPWRRGNGFTVYSGAVVGVKILTSSGTFALKNGELEESHNLDFIAAAREDVPALCKALDEARAELDEIKGLVWERIQLQFSKPSDLIRAKIPDAARRVERLREIGTRLRELCGEKGAT